jgi:phage/plasmid primase-like uncharacterized protein
VLPAALKGSHATLLLLARLPSSNGFSGQVMYDLNEAQRQGGGEAGRSEGRAAPSPDEVIAQFRADAAAAGVVIPTDIVLGGELTRCDSAGRHGEGDASYLLHVDGFPNGGFQNWQTGGWIKWRWSGERPPRVSRAERRKQAEANLAAKDERKRLQAEAAEKAREIWAVAVEDDWINAHYLRRKQIQTHGTRREDRDYRVVVPMHDADGALRNVQRIDANGDKRFVKDAPVAGLRYIMGTDADSCAAFIIGEGFATVASVIEAMKPGTGIAGVVAFNSGNLLAVATSIRARYPDRDVMILGDDDRHLPDNPGLTKARAAAEAVGGWLAVPSFGDDAPEGATDFDDVRQMFGPEVVKRQIQAAVQSARQPQISPPDAPKDDPEITSPAHTREGVVALIQSLDPRNVETEGQLSTITMALRGIASLRLDPVNEEVMLKQIKSRSGLSITPIRQQLAVMKRAIGIRAVSTPATNVICRRYVFIKAVNSFWDRDARTMFSLDAVPNAHWHEMPPLDGGDRPRPSWGPDDASAPISSNALAEDGGGERVDPIDVLIKGALGSPCDKVDIISFVPGKNEIFQEEESVALNIWTKPDIVPIEGDASPFLDHVTYVFDGDHQIVEYVLDFLAHLVQRPDIKVKTTILIIGIPGIGKTLIGQMVCKLVGERNTTAIEESDLTSAFNEWMDGVQLVLVNELMTVDKRAAMNRLKSYITDPWLRINRKNVPTYRYQNRANFFLCSNYEDAAKIEKGDRRYLIWISKAEPRGKEYYDDLFDWFDRGGAERLLHFLMNRDLSRFNPSAAPPDTQAKQTVIEDSREPLMAYFQDAFDSGDPPFRHDLVAVNHIIDWLAEKPKKQVTHKQVSMFLRQIKAEALGQKRIRNGGRRASIWAIRNAAEWEQVGEGDIIKAWRDIDEGSLPDIERDELLGRT